MATASQLRNAVAGTSPGTRVPLKVFRDGEELTLEVEIGELAGQGPPGRAGAEGARQLGMSVETLTPEVARTLGEENARGVAVREVERAGPAARAPGDIIVGVGGRSVSDLAGFRKAMEGADLAKGIRLQILREGVKRFVIVKEK